MKLQKSEETADQEMSMGKQRECLEPSRQSAQSEDTRSGSTLNLTLSEIAPETSNPKQKKKDKLDAVHLFQVTARRLSPWQLTLKRFNEDTVTIAGFYALILIP